MEPQLLLERETDDGPARLVLVSVDDLPSAGEALVRVTRAQTAGEGGFALLLLLDGASQTTDDISDLAETCIAEGLFWLSAWGPGCERVHDIFDEVDARRLDGAAVYDAVMTAWHEDEELSDVLRFFWHGAFAASPREGGSLRLVLVVGQPEGADTVEALTASGLQDQD